MDDGVEAPWMGRWADGQGRDIVEEAGFRVLVMLVVRDLPDTSAPVLAGRMQTGEPRSSMEAETPSPSSTTNKERSGEPAALSMAALLDVDPGLGRHEADGFQLVWTPWCSPSRRRITGLTGPLSEPAPQRQHQCVPGCWTPPCPRAPVRVADPCFFLASFRTFQRQPFDNNTTTKLPAVFRQPPCNGTLPCRFCDSPALTTKMVGQSGCLFPLQHQPSHLCCTSPPVPSGGHPAQASFSQRTALTAHPCMSSPAAFSVLI